MRGKQNVYFSKLQLLYILELQHYVVHLNKSDKQK